MSFLDRLFRSNPLNVPGAINDLMTVNSFLDSLGGNSRSDSGEVVNILTSLQTSTVWACVNLISQQIAINPLNLYQIDDNGNKTEASSHDYFDLIANNPNPEADSISFRTAVQTSIELTGNGYIEIQRDNGNRVVALWHRSSERTHPFRLPNGKLAYRTTDSEDQRPREIQLEDMIHLKGLVLNSLIGLNPLEFFRGPIGGKLAMDKYGNRFFANNATPSGILTIQQKVKPTDISGIRADWESQQLGGNQHRVNILSNGATFTPITLAQNDAQFLETKTEIAKEIAAFFGVQGYAVGLLDKGIKANVEQQAQDLYNYCLRPRMAKWEKALSNKLFSNRGRSAGRYVAHFDVFKLLHPDDASIQTSIQSSVQNGVLTPNEGRSWLGLNQGGPEGDRRYIQLNMQTLETANATLDAPGTPDKELALEQEENSLPKGLGQYRGLFKDGVQRVMKVNKRDYKAIYRCLWPTVDALNTAVRSSQKLDIATKPEDEGYKTIERLLKGMESRADKWTEEGLDQVCDDELKRAQKALIFAAYKDTAILKAKKVIDQLEADEAEQE